VIATVIVNVDVQFPLMAVNTTSYEPFAANACTGEAAEDPEKSAKSQEYDVASVDVFVKVTTFPLTVNVAFAVGVVPNVMAVGEEVPTPAHASAFVVVTV
jgi:hypothetical protein